MTKTMAIADCLECKRPNMPIKGRGLCPRCHSYSEVRRKYPLVERPNQANWRKCKECRQLRSIEARGLCRRCYETPDIREKYPAMSKREQGNRFAAAQRERCAMNRLAGVHEEKMPETVYAIVRRFRSPYSGKIRVMIGWYRTPRDARRIASKCCRHFSCRVERWTQVNRNYNGDAERRLQKRRGTMNYETVAVYPRRGGKRVAA